MEYNEHSVPSPPPKPKELNPYAWLIIGIIVAVASVVINKYTNTNKFILFLAAGIVMVIYSIILLIAKRGLDKEKRITEEMKRKEDAISERKYREMMVQHQHTMAAQEAAKAARQRSKGSLHGQQAPQTHGGTHNYAGQQGQGQQQYSQHPLNNYGYKYCPNCMSAIRHTDTFCFACGVRVK